MEFFSPLRYPGGKAKVTDFVQCLIKENALLDGAYVEPYVGGGSVALSLLFNEYVRDIYINDKDLSIYAFWHSVLYESDALCKLIKETPINVDTWFKLKKYQSNKENIDLLNLGFSTFYLNRTNRSGILKAGVIGGYDQTGNYKIDARFNKDDLIKRIQRITDYADRIHLTNEDAVILVQRLKGELPNKTLFYLDPPYYVKGKGLYMNYYNDQDHQNIANAIKEIRNHKWIISYDNVSFIKDLYSKYRKQTFELNYSASNSGKGKEIMIFCDNIIIPKHNIFNGFAL
jgi:DNA adenine methylase